MPCLALAGGEKWSGSVKDPLPAIYVIALYRFVPGFNQFQLLAGSLLRLHQTTCVHNVHSPPLRALGVLEKDDEQQ